ncbi:hypothetical protein BofuT4_uP123680.1 [Botrytis cinerea T4]|uniref:Uncharacterized protein n=1 Tax=Botryotinia fuckeliana (strain T4) TaxID=999810 RepID=G2YP01_BOTF4|nr:hypothetical protein BofuT4_uP123680.1 [Botrytis cinerea T4]
MGETVPVRGMEQHEETGLRLDTTPIVPSARIALPSRKSLPPVHGGRCISSQCDSWRQRDTLDLV